MSGDLPLAGVRVLDLSNVLAGPFCAYTLARMGADVVKIENPRGGDLARSLGADPAMAARGQGLSFVAVNAGKRSVAIDLKDARGREVFLRLVDSADVVLENFRPDVMERLGLGWSVLSARNPRLILCAISGFGAEGPWASRPAYDQIVQGLSGVMSITGGVHSAPLRVGYPLCDTLAGMTGAFAIAAALVEQRRTGRGRRIDVSLLESTLAAMGWVVSNHLNGDVDPQPMGNENFTAAPSGTFRTGEGLLNISANEQKQFEALCGLLGRADLAEDPRFAARQARKENRAALKAAIEASLASASAAVWEERLNAAGVPAGRVLTVPEVLASDQLQARGFVETLAATRTDGAPLRVTRPGFLLATPFPPPDPPPALGAHTRDLLRDAGLDAESVAALAEAGVIAMPAAAREGTAAGETLP